MFVLDLGASNLSASRIELRGTLSLATISPAILVPVTLSSMLQIRGKNAKDGEDEDDGSAPAAAATTRRT